MQASSPPSAQAPEEASTAHVVSPPSLVFPPLGSFDPPEPTDERAQLEAALLHALAVPADAGLLAMARAHFASGGKRLRARLALAAARVLGVEHDAAMAWAAGCEILHNATLVHDDVQDGDRVRRGEPTVWARHGVAQAINVGDWLFMRALLSVAEAPATPAPVRGPLLQLLAQSLQVVIVGQARECGWRGGAIVHRDDYRQMVREKTAALFVLPVAGAALLAAAPPARSHALCAGFAPVGELFQLADDVIDLFGDKGRAAPGQDLYEGKMSALVVEHAARRPEDRAWLAELLATPRDSTPLAQVARARAAFVDSGALAATLQQVDLLAADARRACASELVDVLNALLSAVEAPLAAARAHGGSVL